MKKLLIIILLLQLFPLLWRGSGSEAYAQDQHLIDSLRNVLTIQNEDTGKVNILITLGYQFNAFGDRKGALHYLHEALALSEKLNYQPGKANAYMGLGSVYRLSVSEAEGLIYYYKALKVIELTGDKRQLAYCYQLIGFSQYWQENHSEAYNAFRKCLKLSRENNDTIRIIESLSYLVNECIDRKEYDAILKIHAEVMQLSKSIGYSRGIGYSNSGYAMYWTKQSEHARFTGNPILANDYLKKSIEFNQLAAKNFEDANDFGAAGDCYNRIANIAITLSMFPQAAKNLNKAFEYAEKTGYDDNFKNAYKSYSDLDSAQGNFKQAYKNYKMYIVYHDKIINLENSKKAFQAKAQYDTEKKEQQITLLTKEAKLQQTDLQKQNTTRNVLIAAFLLITLLVAVTFNRYSIKQRANAAIEKTLHHLKTTQEQLIEREKLATLGKFTADVAKEMEGPVKEINQLTILNRALIRNIKKSNSNVDADVLQNNLQHIFKYGKEADVIVKKVLVESRRTKV